MGQKQRMGGKGLVGKPRLLVLDELAANLDRKTEEAIIQNIKAMKTRMTLLVSTYSNAFDSIADQILLLEDNQSIRIGHEEVADLVKLQSTLNQLA